MGLIEDQQRQVEIELQRASRQTAATSVVSALRTFLDRVSRDGLRCNGRSFARNVAQFTQVHRGKCREHRPRDGVVP